MPTMSRITNEYLTLGKYLRYYSIDPCFVFYFDRIDTYLFNLVAHIHISYVELAKKSEPNKSFLEMTCSETQPSDEGTV
jgi:hypothetical protein